MPLRLAGAAIPDGIRRVFLFGGIPEVTSLCAFGAVRRTAVGAGAAPGAYVE